MEDYLINNMNKMNLVSIAQFNLTHPNGRQDRLAILKCDEGSPNPKGVLEYAVNKYVVNEGFNEFVQIELDNPWMRLIIRDINELNYQQNQLLNYDDVEIFNQTLIDRNEAETGRVSILRGGLNSEKPIAYMAAAVREYAGDDNYLHFVEIYLDNPWVRVLIFNIDQLQYEPFNNQTINGEI
jgi:hypothetical protein